MSSAVQHVRPKRLRFLSNALEWDMGQSSIHFKLSAFMWQALRRIVGRGSTVAVHAEVYFEDKEASRYSVPDVFIRLGVPDDEFSEWYPWETGAPDLCVEFPIRGMSAVQEIKWKVQDLSDLGVREVVAFDYTADEGKRLRAWDRVGGKLVERKVRGERTPCTVLGKWFHVARLGEIQNALAIADDEAGNGMILPDAERAQRAEARVKELEELLRARG